MSAPAQIGEPDPSSSHSTSGAFSFRTEVWLRIALFATAVVYLPTITYGFVYDDPLEIEMNPWIQSWKFWKLFFTGGFWSFARSHVRGNYYRPLTSVWLTANFSLFHLTPGWWHLTTVAAHIVATVFVYRVAARLLRDRSLAVVAALLFGLDPTHIEVVAWVSSIPELLMTVFFLSALLAFLNWQESKRTAWMLCSGVCYAAALLSKETGLAFLPVACVLLWNHTEKPLVDRLRTTVLRALPFVAISGAYMLARAHAIGGLTSTTFHRSPTSVALTWPAALSFYLVHLFWPFRLSVLYDFDLVKSFSFAAVVLPALIFLAGLAAIAWVCRKRRLAPLALVWIVTPLVPVLIGIKYFQWNDYVHDRYLYLASVMACMVVGMALKEAAEWIASRNGLAHGARFASGAVTILALGLFVSTLLQVRQWESDASLFKRAHERAPHNPLATDFHARILFGEGRTAEAIAEFQDLLRRNPDYWQGAYVLGIVYYQSGDYANAENYLTLATQIWPRQYTRPDATQFYYLGLTQQHRNANEEAEKSLRRAIDLRPDAPGYRMALAKVLKQRGDLVGANEQMRLDLENRKAFAAREKGIGVGD